MSRMLTPRSPACTYPGVWKAARVRPHAVDPSREAPWARLCAGDGFMLIETLVASVVLVTVLLGTFLLLDVATKTSAATRAREGAVTLAREISEDSRAIPFSQLSPSVISTQLQAMPGLANAGTPPTWQVVRRGFTYTVTTTECSIDDPKDGY